MGVWLLILAMLLVVMFHEAGHFMVAKAFGFKATKFFVGFGPTIWSRQKGETEYGIKALPLGGFVKIVGMNPYEEIPPEDVPRSYGSKPRWQRALVLLAGSAMHFVLVFILLIVVFILIGFPTGEISNQMVSVQVDSPADAAGFEPRDRIVAIDGTETDDWLDIRRYIRDHGGETGTFTVVRDDETVELTAELGFAVFDEEDGPVDVASERSDLRALRPGEKVVGVLGVSPAREYAKESLFGAVGESARGVWTYTRASVTGIGQVFTQVFDGSLVEALQEEGERGPDEGPVGVVGASRVANEIVAKGEWMFFIDLLCSFTIFIALMNLLPLPPLDGGHLAVVAYESVTGRSIDLRKLIPVAAAVISFFVLLSLAVLYLDLARPMDFQL